MSAIALLRSAIGDDEGDRLLYDRACELLLESGKSQEAMDLAEEGLARFDGDLALMSRLGYACAAEGETKRALDQWARVRQAHPSAEAGWIEGAMCGASLGSENEAGELLGAYLSQLENRLSLYWWDRVLRVAEVILLGYSEDRHVRGLLEVLFLRVVAPDLSAHIELLSRLYQVAIQKRRILNSRGIYRENEKIFNLLKDIHRRSLIGRDDDEIIALELALGIVVERESSDHIREFVAGLSYSDFCIIFTLRYEALRNNLLRKRDGVQEIIAALPVTDPHNARKCLAARYALDMDYSVAYEALTGLPLPATREGYLDFAYAAYAGNGRPKVAFCISGQLRGYREAFASWEKSRLFADCDVSVFVHTWPEIGAAPFDQNKAHRTFGGNFLQAFVKECSVIGGIDKFGEVYPRLVHTVTNPQVVSAAELTEFYETQQVVVESEEAYRDYTNAEKMYYKIQACWELACTGGEEFHVVFRVRPDLMLRNDSKVDWCKVVEESQDKRMAYVKFLSFYRTGLAVEEQLGFGNPAAMAVYCTTWDRTKDPNGLIRAHRVHFVPHTTLALNLVEHEVKAIPFPEGFALKGLAANAERPSLESLRDALEKDLAPNSRHQNPMWRALEEDMSHES